MNNATAHKEQKDIRLPAVDGLFYPSDAAECREAVDQFLRAALVPETPCPKALIVPHAGYIYSGAVAAVAYKKLIQHRHHFSRVALLGPSHRVALTGIAMPACTSFRTPLGDITLDVDQMQQVRHMSGVAVSQGAHVQEHSLEVQLPFLQQVLEQFTLVPLVVGDVDASVVASVVDYFWQQPETLIVVSSDLSHYLDYENACETDRDTANLIEQLRPVLHGEQACGCNALNGLLMHARGAGAEIECVEMRNSGDTAGDKERVVGYGSFIIY